MQVTMPPQKSKCGSSSNKRLMRDIIMNKPYVKKILAVIVFLLFMGMNVVSSTGTVVEKKSTIPISDGNILYVGGSGGGNYSTIQSAIDDANSGDTVFVYDDSSPYYENIEIDKSINLIGENRETTKIYDDWDYYSVIYSCGWEYCAV